MSNNFHSIKAILYPNLLTDDPNDFIAKAISEKTLEVFDVCQSAVERGGADTTAQTMEYNVNLFFKEMAYRLCNGFSVNTGYFIVRPQFKGAFNSPKEKFTLGKHTLFMQFIQGELMRRMLPDVKVEILGVAENGIGISQVTDVKSKTVNDLLTPKHNLVIKGDKIKQVGEHADVGIYFINQADNLRVKVPADDIVINHPSELIILIPDLTAGTYLLEIISQYSNSTLLKYPRKAVFNRQLIVQ
jgi:hypothetical protein